MLLPNLRAFSGCSRASQHSEFDSTSHLMRWFFYTAHNCGAETINRPNVQIILRVRWVAFVFHFRRPILDGIFCWCHWKLEQLPLSASASISTAAIIMEYLPGSNGNAGKFRYIQMTLLSFEYDEYGQRIHITHYCSSFGISDEIHIAIAISAIQRALCGKSKCLFQSCPPLVAHIHYTTSNISNFCTHPWIQVYVENS